jgi:hypothetical protein
MFVICKHQTGQNRTQTIVPDDGPMRARRWRRSTGSTLAPRCPEANAHITMRRRSKRGRLRQNAAIDRRFVQSAKRAAGRRYDGCTVQPTLFERLVRCVRESRFDMTKRRVELFSKGHTPDTSPQKSCSNLDHNSSR